MREIKFRGKRVNAGKWVYGCLILCSYGAFIKDTEDKHTNPRQIDGFHKTADFRCVEVDPATIGQFTGKTVKTGKVFDGDIGESIDGRFLVVWDEGKAAFVMRFYDGSGDALYLEEIWDNAKIIGDIHSNPSLLEATP